MSLLTDGLDKLNISYDENQLEQVDLFYDLLSEKNKVMNLTAIIDKNDFILKHVLDSLLSFNYYKFYNETVIDIGTGAGFPGIPLKIFFPFLNITLVDSVNKKLKFIDIVIEKLHLENIKTIHGRAEDLARKEIFREKYDLGVSRAVANLSTLSELCLPFIKVGGKFIFYKAFNSDEEINSAGNALTLLGNNSVSIYDSFIPGSDIQRKFIIAEKHDHISDKYPRKAGEPGRHPL